MPPLLPFTYRRLKLWLVPRLPKANLNDVFPGIELTPLSITAREIARESGTLPLGELLTIAAICSYVKPRRVFEFGTYRGATSLVIAMHTPADAEIFTLDLPPRQRESKYPIDNGDITGREFVVGDRYRDTEFAPKICQVYGDSATFNFDSYCGRMDLVFVDGNHRYENARVDSENAFRMLSPGGVIVWDDYDEETGPGVIRALHEMADRGILAISATRLAVHMNRAPVTARE